MPKGILHSIKTTGEEPFNFPFTTKSIFRRRKVIQLRSLKLVVSFNPSISLGTDRFHRNAKCRGVDSVWRPGRHTSPAAVVPTSVPPPVVVVHPRLATLASPAKPAAPAVGSKEFHFFLKNPNFGFGFAGVAASVAIHSCIFATSHVT